MKERWWQRREEREEKRWNEQEMDSSNRKKRAPAKGKLDSNGKRWPMAFPFSASDFLSYPTLPLFLLPVLLCLLDNHGSAFSIMSTLCPQTYTTRRKNTIRS
jgi:hypothetical protein